MRETTVIGDIHGQSAVLQNLLRYLAPTLRSDSTVVMLGDYIDRGPDSCGVIEQLLELQSRLPGRFVALLGNHEEWMLETLRDFTRHSWLLGMKGLSTIESYSAGAAEELRNQMQHFGPRLFVERIKLPYELFFDAVPGSHLAFVQQLVRCYEDDRGFYSHAGLDPSRPLSDQDSRTLTWGRDYDLSDYRGKTVVYGHWNNMTQTDSGRLMPYVCGATIGIDSIAHGALTAVRLPSKEFLQVTGDRVDVFRHS